MECYACGIVIGGIVEKYSFPFQTNSGEVGLCEGCLKDIKRKGRLNIKEDKYGLLVLWADGSEAREEKLPTRFKARNLEICKSDLTVDELSDKFKLHTTTIKRILRGARDG